MEIGFIGLGAMGLPIADNLRKAGHSLTVYNRTTAKAEQFAKAGGRVVTDAVEACQGDIVISMLADDNAMESTFFKESNGSSVIERQAPHTVHIGLSTIGVDLARKLEKAYAGAGGKYISATVMGRPDVAARADLVVMAAGDSGSIDKCRPVFDAIGRALYVVSERPSAANVTKLAANFMLTSMIHTMGEAVALVRKNGIDEHLFYEVIMKDFFASPVYAKYGKLIVDRQYEGGAFTVKLQEKDVRLALNCAQSSQVPMPTASVLENTFLGAIGRGLGAKDPVVIAQFLAENAGLSE
jgi:3-hydroxyisobutyrate dehydrogenase-like beta-hydroxyacid dehydrogenase